MADNTPDLPDEPPATESQEDTAWPRRQIYYVTVEWLDEPHRPEATERLARALRHAIEHAHSLPPETPPARFVVRVKYGDVAAEIEGRVEHHHHHHDHG